MRWSGKEREQRESGRRDVLVDGVEDAWANTRTLPRASGQKAGSEAKQVGSRATPVRSPGLLPAVPLMRRHALSKGCVSAPLHSGPGQLLSRTLDSCWTAPPAVNTAACCWPPLVVSVACLLTCLSLAQESRHSPPRSISMAAEADAADLATRVASTRHCPLLISVWRQLGGYASAAPTVAIRTHPAWAITNRANPTGKT